MLKFIVVVAIVSLVGVSALELRLNNNVVVDTDKVDCKKANEIIDECSLQQGFSYRFPEYPYPTNHTYLMRSCKLQGDALKCLRAYSKCLPPLSRQVMLALVNSRQRFNKKICLEKPSDNTNKALEFGQCMRNDRSLLQKGALAETNAIIVPESLVNHKFASVSDRLKYSCCSVAKARREFTETILPGCKQHSQAAIDMIDSYLADTVGIICPDQERLRNDCEKLPKIPVASQPSARHFIGPIINVVQTLA